jgi:hypothetical protein
VSHEPLTETRDDIFFKFCKMRGVAFDVVSKSGTLFHLIDAVISGIISISCIAPTRKRALEISINTLTFIATQFGRKSFEGDRGVADLQTILAQLKYVLRRLEKVPGGSVHSGSMQPSL